MTDSFRVRVEGPGTDVNREVDAETVGRVLALLFGTEVEPMAPPPSPGYPSSPTPPRASLELEDEDVRRLREILRPARNNPQRLAAIAVFLEETLEEDEIGLRPTQFEEWFELAGEKVPANVWQEVQKAVDRGLLREGPWKGRYQATSQAFADFL